MRSAITSGLLIAIIFISGCAQSESATKATASINDFRLALENLKINGVQAIWLLDQGVGGLPMDVLTVSWFQMGDESYIVLRIRLYSEQSLAQDYYKIIKERSQVNPRFSEVTVAGETISKVSTEVPTSLKGKMSAATYFWVHDNFYFELGMNSDTDAYKTIGEKIIGVYKSEKIT